MNTNDTSFRVGRRYRIAVEPGRADGPTFGGCDVSLGGEFVCSYVDLEGDAWSIDVTLFGVPSVELFGWCVARRDYLRLGYVVPVADEVAT